MLGFSRNLRALGLVGVMCCAALALCHNRVLGDSIASDGNTSIAVNPGNSTNPIGLYSWKVNGVEQAYEKWFWFRTAGSAYESSVDQLSLAVETNAKGCQLNLVYDAWFGAVDILYGVSSEPYGAGTSAFEERVTITNTTASTLDLMWFEYTNFNVGATPQDELAYHVPSLFFDYRSWPDVLIQQDGARMTGVFSGTPASAYEIALDPSLYQSLTDGGLTTLNNTPPSGVPIGPGDLAHAMQYELSIEPGQSAQLYTLNVLIPEPATLSLLVLGGLGLVRRR